jgi:methylated-DNA-[protein]-cysteine S-methyltransferase
MITIYVKKLEDVWFGVAYDGDAVFATAFSFSQERALLSLLESVPFDVPFQQTGKPSVLADLVVAVSRNVYDGKDVSRGFSLDTERLPDYARRVLDATCLIPTGYVASYGSIARCVGGGARAVGNVMAGNPFAPIVPCHRVVRSDFTLGGYGGGLDVKLQLLKRERRGFPSPREVPVGGNSLMVFPVEFVLKKVEKTRQM